MYFKTFNTTKQLSTGACDVCDPKVDFFKNCGRDAECVSDLVVKGALELP